MKVKSHNQYIDISEFITGAEYEIVHFRRGAIEEGEDVLSDRLDAGSLLDVTWHLRV